MTDSTIFLSADFSLDETETDSAPSKFSGLLYSGGLIDDYGIVIDLESTAVDPPMPLLHEHNRDAVIGTITAAQVKRNRLEVSGELFTDIDDTAAKLAAKHKRGARYQMSAGVYGYRVEEVPAGNKVRVNGQSFTGPLSILRGGRIREGSVVTLGADRRTAVSFFSHPGGTPKMANPSGDQRIATLESAVAELSAKLEAANKRAADAESALLAATAEQRKKEVQALFSAVGLDFTEDAAKPYMDMPEVSFSAAAKVMRDMHAARKPKVPESLFSQQVSDGANGGQHAPLSTADIYATRNHIKEPAQ